MALAGQGVGADVHLQCPKADVLLVAVFADKLLLDECGAVELLVLGESGEGGIALIACLTLVTGWVIVLPLAGCLHLVACVHGNRVATLLLLLLLILVLLGDPGVGRKVGHLTGPGHGGAQAKLPARIRHGRHLGRRPLLVVLVVMVRQGWRHGDRGGATEGRQGRGDRVGVVRGAHADALEPRLHGLKVHLLKPLKAQRQEGQVHLGRPRRVNGAFRFR